MSEPVVSLDQAYAERVYAGVLGKIIGVYLGRPFEGWHHDQIKEKLGPIEGYVHDRLGAPLIVTDDDISGTFTFIRALEDNGCDPELTPQQVAQAWLNYIVEKRTILWWGGMGTSTEHTAYLRLKQGIPAPQSGSIALNGAVVAEQIGAQIFIDGWGLVNPGDPERAAHFARVAGSVSHDGEAIYGAQVVAAMVAAAFVETRIDRLFDVAFSLVPSGCTLARMAADIRHWHAQDGDDWERGFRRIEETYGYARFGGGCHMVPNHGLILHALLHGKGDFGKSLMVVNTCGWDTDCNSGNVGCILGVLNGLAGMEGPVDWRGPVADRMYLPTADGGRAVTDAAQEAYRLVNAARRLRDLEPVYPKLGARFHFSFPGSVQGFVTGSGASLRNEGGRLRIEGGPGCRVSTETFPGPQARSMGGYGLSACPTLYPGQTVRAQVSAPGTNLQALELRLSLGQGNAAGGQDVIGGPTAQVGPGQTATLAWTVPDLGGYPACDVGIEITRGSGAIHLDWLTWNGSPTVRWTKVEGELGRQSWVNAVDEFSGWGEAFRLIQNEGTGMLIQGTRGWSDYRVEAKVTPHMVEFGGIAARVQGLRRYYALVLDRSGDVRLIKELEGTQVLDSQPVAWGFGQTRELRLDVVGDEIAGFVDGVKVVSFVDEKQPLESGAVAFVLKEGRMASDAMTVRAL